jgi:hypothetical protein
VKLLLQVTHVKLQGDDDPQARLQDKGTPHPRSNAPPPRAPMLQCLSFRSTPPTCHSLNPSILKSSPSLHVSIQATQCCLGLKCPPPKCQMLLLQCKAFSKQATSLHVAATCRMSPRLHRSPMLQGRMSIKHPYEV